MSYQLPPKVARESDPLIRNRRNSSKQKMESADPEEARRQPLQHQDDGEGEEDDEYMYGAEEGLRPEDSASIESGSQPPLLEIPEEIYAVRKDALQVLKPLTKTWVSGSVVESFSTFV